MDLLRTLIADGEHIAETALPNVSDLPALFSGLVHRLEATLPQLTEYDIKELLEAAENRKAAAIEAETQPPAHGQITGATTTITTEQPPQGQVQQVRPSESAGTAAGGAPSESPALAAAKALREQAAALEAEAAPAHVAGAAEATAAGAQGGAVVSDSGVQRQVQGQ